MGYSSQSGQVVVGRQTGPGVLNPNLATEGISVRLRSGSLAGNRDLLTPDPEIGGGRDRADAYLGAVNFSGDYEMYARFRALAFFLEKALGVVDSTDQGDGVYEHVITPSDGQLPFFSVHETISEGLERFYYTDAVCNTFHLEAEPNGYLLCTAGVLARIATANAPAIDGTALTDNTSMVVGTNIVVRYGGIQVPAKSFSLDVNNNYEDDDYRLGSFFMGDLTAKGREVTASMTLRHNDNLTMRQALFGSSAATQIGGLTTKDVLEIDILSYEDIPGSTTKFGLTLELPKVVFSPFAFTPSGDDALENDIEMTALRPDLADPIMTATIVNDRADVG